MFCVPLCPISVINQCFMLFLYFFLHLSRKCLVAHVAILLSNSYPSVLFSYSVSSSFIFSIMSIIDSLLNVSVTNIPVLFVFISSVSLACHPLAFCFLHSMHFPHPTATFFTLSSLHIGTIPLFFFVCFIFFVVY